MFLFDKEKDPNKFILVPGQESETQYKLDAGVYNLALSSNGPMSPPTIAFEKTAKYEDGMNIEGGVFTKARATFEKFIRPEMYEAREAMEMMHKLGVIFDGKPGTGKTFLAGQIASEFAKKHDAVSIVTTDNDINFPALIDSVREFDEDRLIVIVMDEFEKSGATHSSKMLSFLDGTNSKNNVIVIATINDIGQMPSYLKDRPGRFEHILKFKSDDVLILKSIVTQCIPDSFKPDFDVDELVKSFTNKANSNKFGLKNERDDFTVDRLRVVIRDLIADTIKNKSDLAAIETVTVDTVVQKTLAQEGIENVIDAAVEAAAS